MPDGEESNKGLTPEQVAAAEQKIRELFRQVLDAAEKIITADNHFGYLKIEENIDPRIEDILLGLRLLETIFDVVHDSPIFKDEYTIRNECLNAKQCVWHIKMISSSLQCKNEEAYLQAINELKRVG